jgi:hypothetical protein
MSFEIFLSNFKDGETVPLPRSLLYTIFGKFCLGIDADSWELQFPDGGQCQMTVDYFSPSAGITVSRPPASLDFWDGILKLLKETTSCLYWPGGGPAVANLSVREHLPADMIQGLGEPIVVKSSTQIIAAIKKS